MTERYNYQAQSPQALRGMMQLEAYIAEAWKSRGSLDHSLVELVKLRVSQINGCAYCLDMHSKDALAAGESFQRIVLLDAWRETNFYTDTERAALAWAESLTRIADAGVPDEVYDQARAQFSDQQLMDLTVVCLAINSWNRVAIAFRTPPGSYKPTAVD